LRLLFRRDQRSAFTSTRPVFQLDVRAEISAEEKAAIARYRLGGTILYQRDIVRDRSSGFVRLALRLADHALNLTISVDDLTRGKRVECKDIVEMLFVEQQLREAGERFAAILYACTHFGGAEVLELQQGCEQ